MLLSGKRILIGFAEAAAAPEVVFSLRRAGLHITAFTRTGARPSIARLRGIEVVEVARPEDDLEACRAAVAALAGRGFDLVMALDDAALWLIEELRAGGHIPEHLAIAGPTGDQARLALDKRQQIALAAEAGFAVPETRLVSCAADLDGLATPYMLKGALAAEIERGRLTRAKAAYADTSASLGAAREAASRMQAGLAQPFIHGVGEGVFGLARNGEILAASGHRRIRMTNPHGSGSCACEFRTPAPETMTAAGRFLGLAGWNGLFMIELLRDDTGRLWFMELNGRPWGSMALARRAGFDYPAWAARAALDPEFVPASPAPADGLLVRNLGNELVHLMFVLRGPKTEMHRRDWPRFWPTAGHVLAPQAGSHFYNWDPDHPGFFVRDAADTVARLVRQRM